MNSLRTRLIAFYLGIIVLGFGGLTFWSARQIVNSTISDFGGTLQIQAFFLANSLVETLEYNPAGASNAIVQSVENLNGDATLFSPSGEILITSDRGQPLDLISSDNYVIELDRNGNEQIIAAAPILDEDTILGYVQLNVPKSIPAANARQRQFALWSVFAAFSLLGTSATLWLVTSMTRPLEDLQQTALDMAEGDLTQRVADPGPDEIGDVGRAFNTMATKVEEIVADQRAFASNASHELRTPLTTIRLRTEMMLNDDLGEDVEQEFIEEIDSEVKRMSGLVNDLLLLSRIDAKRLSAGTEQIDAARLLARVNREFMAAAADKKVELDTKMQVESLPITANLNHLETVYRNIIGNSLKYTDEGGRVTINLAQQTKKMVFTVVDTGEGIPPEDLASIGKRFFRVDRARGRKVVGTGLGLALVKSILELYEGTFDIMSEGKGNGTTVQVEWPIGP